MELITSRPLSTVPLSPVDVFNSVSYPTLMFLYRQGLDVTRLKEALRTVLAEVPDVAGRLIKRDGQYCIAWNDAGVGFDVIDVNTAMPDYGFANPTVEAPPLSSLPNPAKIVNADLPLCRFQVTRFRCSAAILTMHISHVLCDGFGRGWFLARWARICRGAPALPPMDVDRNTLIRIAELYDKVGGANAFKMMRAGELKKQFEAFHRGPFSLKALRVSAAELTALRDKTIVGLKGERISRQDVLVAKVWRTLALAQPDPSPGKLFLVQDFRRNAEFGLGEHYFGNAVTTTSLDHDAADIAQQPLGILAQRIRTNTIKALSFERIAADLAFQWRHATVDGASLAVPKEWVDFPKNQLGINNFSRFPLSELDFGTGAPFWVFGNLWASGRSVTIFPLIRPDDPGYAVYINIPEDHLRSLLPIIADDPFFHTD